MTTNYGRYFSTPEKASEMQVYYSMPVRGWVVTRFDMDAMDLPEQVALISCDNDDPAELYAWMCKEV